MNYLKKFLSFLSLRSVTKNKQPLMVLDIWRVELIIMAILFLLIGIADFGIYRTMVSRGIEASGDRVKTVESLHKETIMNAGAIISEHESKLNNPLFPLIKSPF